MQPNSKLIRKSYLDNKIIFVDGFIGGGKTLFSQLISSIDRVEMWVHRPLIEQVCGLYAHKNIDLNSAINLLKCSFDNEIYNQALLRDQNFRHYDHSSLFKHPKKIEYLKRIFNPNDEDLFKRFINEQRVLHFMSHGITAISDPIFQSLGDRLVFCRLTRSPSSIYMLHHLARWSKRWGNESRNGMMCIEIGEEKVPQFIVNRIDEYANGNEYDRAVIMLEEWLEEGNKVADKQSLDIVEIPFERLVFEPLKYIEKISTRLEIKISTKVYKEMRKQKVPRRSLDDAPSSNIFKGYGWRKPLHHLSVKDQINSEIKEMEDYLKPAMIKRVKRLVEDYTSRHLDK
jgi:hypothetical protein